MTKLMVSIEGKFNEVTHVHNGRGCKMIDLDDGTDWYVFEDSEAAGIEAREYWEDMAENDPKEFACLVGEETLIQWGLGRSAGPGSTAVNSLQEWLDLWLNVPEEHFASYDGSERTCRMSKALMEELDFEHLRYEENGKHHEFVCYRHN